jgi:hypothetical protein
MERKFFVLLLCFIVIACTVHVLIASIFLCVIQFREETSITAETFPPTFLFSYILFLFHLSLKSI